MSLLKFYSLFIFRCKYDLICSYHSFFSDIEWLDEAWNSYVTIAHLYGQIGWLWLWRSWFGSELLSLNSHELHLLPHLLLLDFLLLHFLMLSFDIHIYLGFFDFSLDVILLSRGIQGAGIIIGNKIFGSFDRCGWCARSGDLTAHEMCQLYGVSLNDKQSQQEIQNLIHFVKVRYLLISDKYNICPYL